MTRPSASRTRSSGHTRSVLCGKCSATTRLVRYRVWGRGSGRGGSTPRHAAPTASGSPTEARKLSTDGNYDYAPLNALAGFVTDTEPPSDIRAAAAELGVDIVLP